MGYKRQARHAPKSFRPDMEPQATQPAAVPTGRKRRRVSSSKKPKGEKEDMKAAREREMTLIGLPRAEAEAYQAQAVTGKKCIFQYGKSLENSMFEYPTLDNHWEIYSVPIKVQLFSNTGKMLFIHDLAAGVSLEVYWRTTHLVFQCWTMM